MKEKNKVEAITIKKFCEEYGNRTTQLKQSYLEENLGIEKYVPFIMKNALADRLVNLTTYKYEDYIDEDGKVSRRKTDEIKVDSVSQYLLFCRLVIENYTNLIIENPGFHEEYDELKKCGLLDMLMIGTETTLPLIPVNEIAEFRSIVEMKQKDAIFNATEVHNYISSQVERFGTLTGVVNSLSVCPTTTITYNCGSSSRIWANVYTSDTIVIINPKDGNVEGIIDCSGLLPKKLYKPSTDVLNGIAYDEKSDKIYLTGKNWPKLYEVRIVEKK